MMVCDDGSNIVLLTVGVAQSSGEEPVLSLNKREVSKEMSRKRNFDEFSNNARAQIVRAFYDAAEGIVVEHNGDGNTVQSAQQAISELKKVFDQAQELGPEKFSQALEAAAATYFSRVANMVLFEGTQSAKPAFEAPNGGPKNTDKKRDLKVKLGTYCSYGSSGNLEE